MSKSDYSAQVGLGAGSPVFTPAAAAAAAAVRTPEQLRKRHGLQFAPDERPPWRSSTSLSTSEMLKEITKFEKAYRALPEDSPAARWMCHTFVPSETVQFVLGSNLLEGVGTQRWEATQEALAEQLKKQGALDFLGPGALSPSGGSDIQPPLVTHKPDLPDREVAQMTLEQRMAHAVRETQQTLATLQYFNKQRLTNLVEVQQAISEGRKWNNEEKSPMRVEESFMLDEPTLLEAHHTLMDGLMSASSTSEPGKLRMVALHAGNTLFQGQMNDYIDAASVPQQLDALLTEYNYFCAEMPGVEHADLRMELCYKMVGKMLFRFLNIHPFGNGNGRMSRLLACHALAPVCPFPVHVQPTGLKAGQMLPLPVELQRTRGEPIEKFTAQLADARSVYVAAIEIARFHAQPNLRDQPTLLVAMLIENGFALWRDAFERMKELGLVSSV